MAPRTIVSETPFLSAPTPSWLRRRTAMMGVGLGRSGEGNDQAGFYLRALDSREPIAACPVRGTMLSRHEDGENRSNVRSGERGLENHEYDG